MNSTDIIAQNQYKNQLLATALWYHQDLAWSVVPLHPLNKGICACKDGTNCPTPGKHPWIKWGEYQQKRATKEEITRWWRQKPSSGVGIITGSISDIIVLDIDGPEGERTVQEYELRPSATMISKTGSGGWHYVYKHPGFDSRNFARQAGETLLPGVDFRGDGGLFVAPPTLHISGNYYEWAVSPKDSAAGDPPEWLLELIKKRKRGEGEQLSRLSPEAFSEDITEGQRNDHLTRLTGSLLTKMPPEAALPMLLAWNQARCKPPLSEREVNTIVESIAKAEARKENQEEPPSTSWPEPLAEEAFHGLAGDIVKAIEPHTEADPAALLTSQFALYGNTIGRTAYFLAEADQHYMNMFCCLVGASAKGRKGVSFNQVKRLYEGFDDDWIRDRITQGLSSGEGLIWQVRDEQRTKRKNKKGEEEEEVILVDGIDDKRLLVVEQEFASTIRVLRREGNTLSAVIRKAWDDGTISALTKNSPARATDAHISILGHITKDELLRYLDNTEMANGFGNRFLWVCVKRSKCLPEGGQLHKVNFARIIKRLREAVDFGRTTGEVRRDEEARELWCAVYPELSEGKPGLLGSMLARSEAQVMRLACIYALMDLSNQIRVEHLRAALAVWDYVERSAAFIFGDTLGDPVADEIFKALKEAGQLGMRRTDISNHLGRHKSAKELTRALNLLNERGMALCKKTVSENNRPIEMWYKT